MVKIYIILIFFISFSIANVFSNNCLSCHKDKRELKLFMIKYTLKYSGKKEIKKAIFRFLKSPTSNKSIMPYSYIIKNNFKDDTTLDDQELKKAIDIYYNKFKLQNFIK